MNTSLKVVAILGLLLASQTLAASTMTYTLELGGENYASDYEDYYYPDYYRNPNGGDDGQVIDGTALEDIDWAVIVDIAGIHDNPGGLGDGYLPGGAANLVFDLELREGEGAGGSLVNIGHATLVGGVPQNAGWYSTINDGDADGTRGSVETDPEENAAFCMNFDINGGGGGGGRLFDLQADGGPNMDFYTYPAAQGLPGAATAAAGTLIGMGAGYEEFTRSSGDTAGVGLTDNSGSCIALTILPLFEGQISTKELPGGTYTLILKASTSGNNVLPGHSTGYPICSVLWGGGAFATPPNSVVEDMITFTVTGASYDPPVVTSAESVKTHGTAGDMPIDVYNGEVECRTFGVEKLVVGFDMDIQGVGGLDNSDVSLSSGSVSNVSLSASDELTILMSGTTDATPLTVSFPGIANASDPSKVCAGSLCILQFVGDVNPDLNITSQDRVFVRDEMGKAVTSSNFRMDVRADGTFSSVDRVDVRDAMGTPFVGSCP